MKWPPTVPGAEWKLPYESQVFYLVEVQSQSVEEGLRRFISSSMEPYKKGVKAEVRQAIIYTRVSTEEQVEGDSLAFQERRLRGICDGEGIAVLKVFVEPGVSAKNKDNRPKLLEALKMAKQQLKPGDFFMTFDTSRLTRNHYDGIGMMIELQNKGILFRDATKTYTNSPEDRLFFILNSGLAQFDNEVKARATRERMVSIAKSGEWMHSAPFGYRKGDKRRGEDCLVVIPEESDLVRLIVESLRRGEKPVEVAARLDDFDAFSRKVKSSEGNRNLKFVLRVAKNIIYTARQQTKLTDGVVKGNWSAIVSDEAFNAVQIVLEGKPRVSTPKADPFFLKPVLVCGSCGGKFTGDHPKRGRYHYYRCFHCRKEAIPMWDAHEQLDDLLEELKVSADLVVEIKKSLQSAVSAENKNFDAQRRELQRGVDKDTELLEALEDELVMPKNPTMDRARLAERVGKLQSEVAKKQARIVELEVEGEVDLDVALKVLEGLLSNPKKVFDEMLDVDKAAFVFVLLRGKVICKDKRLQTTESLVPALLFDFAKAQSPAWHPQRDSNPCRHLERVVS